MTSSDSLTGRGALITGASQGLGLEIACAYARAGAHLALCARTESELVEAASRVRDLCAPGQIVHVQTLDVSDRAAVQAWVKAASAALGRLHILVNNAGIYGPIGPIETLEWAAWSRALEINLCGSVHTACAVLPQFKAHGYGKIIQLSGGGATAPLPRFSAYAASKAAVVRFAETLAEEVRDNGIDVNAIAPGALNTRLLDEVLATDPATVGTSFYERAVQQREGGGASIEVAADLAVYLGSEQSDGVTGKLISARWDPWRSFDAHRSDLEGSDIYTLRRIVPADRGKTWGES